MVARGTSVSIVQRLVSPARKLLETVSQTHRGESQSPAAPECNGAPSITWNEDANVAAIGPLACFIEEGLAFVSKCDD